MKKLLPFILLLLSTPALATDCWVDASSGGTGTRTSPYTMGATCAGIHSCLDKIAAGDGYGNIYVASGTYELTGACTIDESGTGDSTRITIQGEGNDRYSWPVFIGTRQLPYASSEEGGGAGNADSGINLFSLSNGIDYITIKNFVVKQIQYVISGQSRENDYIKLQNFYAEDIRNFAYIVAKAGCEDSDTVYDCVGGSSNWDFDDITAIGISKRFIRAEGLEDSTLDNIDASCKGPNGNVYLNDFPLLYFFDGPSNNIDLTNCIGRHPMNVDFNGVYDNGDCFTTEEYTSDITFTGCECYDAADGGYDIKGYGHKISDAIVMKTGNRGIRIWQGPVSVDNVVVGFSAEGENTQYARGSNSAFWISGIFSAGLVTLINNDRPYLFDDTGLDQFNYDGGSGTTPIPGEVVTGGASGNSARIALVSGDAVSGLLLVMNRTGAFNDNEAITTPSGLNALANGTGATDACGELDITNSIIALDHNHTGDSTSASNECAITPSARETNVSTWVSGVSGTDPSFQDPTDKSFEGKNNNMNNSTYGATRGYYNSVTEVDRNEVYFSSIGVGQ